MDIGSNNSFPAGKLSNFTAFSFVIDGVQCASMEGFLQALKFGNTNAQRSTCMLTGIHAKRKGRGRNTFWQTRQTLWWNGNAYQRNSEEYQLLLNRAYNALYTQNEKFRDALSAAGNAIFSHSVGHSNKKKTVLTESEFCRRMQHLKDAGLLREE